MVYVTSNGPQNDIGKYLGPCSIIGSDAVPSIGIPIEATVASPSPQYIPSFPTNNKQANPNPSQALDL